MLCHLEQVTQALGIVITTTRQHSCENQWNKTFKFPVQCWTCFGTYGVYTDPCIHAHTSVTKQESFFKKSLSDFSM